MLPKFRGKVSCKKGKTRKMCHWPHLHTFSWFTWRDSRPRALSKGVTRILSLVPSVLSRWGLNGRSSSAATASAASASGLWWTSTPCARLIGPQSDAPCAGTSLSTEKYHTSKPSELHFDQNQKETFSLRVANLACAWDETSPYN